MERTMKNENENLVPQRRGSSPQPNARKSRNDSPGGIPANEIDKKSDPPGKKNPTEADKSRWQDDGGESAESAA
jgi:hypothetical protein